MKDLPIFFVSGFPRASSTLLMNLLGQNPNHHVTPTSGLIEIFMQLKNGWKNFIEFKAEGLELIKPRIENSLKGMIYGYFAEEFDAGKTIFDKSRGWLNYVEDLESVLKKEVKIIVPIRDVRDILASFEKIYQNRGIEYDYPLGEAFFKCQTIEDRCEYLLSPGGVVGVSINRFRDALNRKIKNRLVIIPAKALTTYPRETMIHLNKLLGLTPYDYNFNQVKQLTHENDMWHGMDLHIIKPEVKPIPSESWKDVLPQKYADDIGKRFKDVNSMANNIG